MSNASTELQRYALVGVRATLFELTEKAQRIKHQFPRLTNLATVVAGLASTIEQVNELTGDAAVADSPPPRRESPRIVLPPSPPASPGVDPEGRRRRARRRSRRASPSPRHLANIAIRGSLRAWAAARDTLTVLTMAPDGITIAKTASRLSTSKLKITDGAARWRLNRLVERGQAELVSTDPPIYKINSVGEQALAEDRDIRK